MLTPSRPFSVWVCTTFRVEPASRSARLSPTQRIGLSWFFRAERTFLFTNSSLSPKRLRRSLCPRITCVVKIARSIGADTSPVKAPEASKCMFCAPSLISDQALEDAMRADRAPYKILQFNDFGLVAITRKRVKQSLERTLCTPCPYCEGAGYVKSPQTVVGEILGEAQKIAAALEGKDVMLRVSPEVAKLLKSNQNTYLQELEEVLGRSVIVKSDPLLHQEKFDLA